MARILGLLCATLLFSSVFSRPSDNNEDVTAPGNKISKAPRLDYRLPESIYPQSYELSIKPDFTVTGGLITFSGAVIIKAVFLQNTKRITIHAGNNLHLFSVRLNYVNNYVTIPVLSTERDPEREFLHIATNGNLIGSSFYISIAYTGTFTDDMDGFYRTFFKEGGKERMLLATQFQPTMARNAFPCLDEPAQRATFQLTLYAPKGYGALSNTPLDKVASDSSSSEATKFVFKITPPMSPHLLSFLIFPEDSYGPTAFGVTTHSEVTFFSWSLKSDISAGRAQYGLLLSPGTLDLLEEYLDLPYIQDNLTKVDQAVIPNFGHEAKENWGLVQYRADRLLVDPSEGNEFEKEMVAEYMANELAHQWFGNRIVPEWWDYAWLSEGLDEFFQYWVVATLEPDWRMGERLVVEQQQSALVTDGRSDTLALTHAVYTPKEIAQQLTPFVSAKGASIMQMILNLMGDNALRNALRSYLDPSSRRDGTVTPSTLGFELEKNKPSNITINLSTFLITWTENVGYPVVTVDRDYSSGNAKVTQDRFTYSPTSGSKIDYYVPLTLRHGSKIERKILTPADEDISFQGISDTDWVLLNSIGYYRVNYDADNWKMLRKELESDPSGIPSLERAQLVDDSFNLARAGVRTYKEALSTAAYLHLETDYVPWAAAFPNLRFLERMLVNEDTDGALKNFTLYILAAVYSKLGFDVHERHLDKLLHGYILRVACKAGDVTCLITTKTLLDEYIEGKQQLDPDIRDAVICYGIQGGKASDWKAVSDLLATSQVESERRAIIKGLGCTSDKATLEEYLKRAVTGEDLKANEKPSVFTAVYANALGVDVVLDSLVTDFNSYLESFGERILETLIRHLAEYLVTDQQVQKLRQLATEHPEMVEELTGAYSIASDNVVWVKSYAEEVVKALEEVTPELRNPRSQLSR